ncbi:hypothetical protein [Halogeometricum luteum]|uniref:Uncharacterized protein n=1 Tax=Halogeometricum luteum TaxID=2950537 RepID=A0ABU2G124_9EURY|nr:hypothetical protein [Halogeometricum sp. S3BR5-2]MDS0294487.1 hypothetical protein [Halogeometricum sp. S3BR5-2]
MATDDAVDVRAPLLTIIAMSLLLVSGTDFGLFALVPFALIVVAVAQVWRVTGRETER